MDSFEALFKESNDIEMPSLTCRFRAIGGCAGDPGVGGGFWSVSALGDGGGTKRVGMTTWTGRFLVDAVCLFLIKSS